MKQSGISFKKMHIYNICVIVLLAIFMILAPYLSADATTATENQEIKAETISNEESQESSEDIENRNEDKLYEAEENQIANEDDSADIKKNIIGSWAKDGQGWHFYNSEGIMQNGFCTIDNKKYYFGSDGIMRSGWQNIEGRWYYFGGANDGSAKRNWQYIGGHWFFFESNYIMVSDTIKEISGSKYAFDAGGAMLSGTFKFKDNIYATTSSGAIKDSGWILYNRKWYYKESNSEIIKNSMHDIGGLRYSFDADGVMRTGWQNVEGRWYYFGGANDGSAKRNWQSIGGRWYFFESNYVMVSDTIKNISGSTYAFDTSGAMLLGKFNFHNKTYVTDASGHLMIYDNSVEAKAREIASKLGYNIYKALNYCAGMSRYYLTKNGRTSNPIMSSAKYAMYGYKNYGGDCLVMASAFKYLAQACGYNCTQWFGWVGSSTHSWCEIGGYVYDPNFINATNRGKHGFPYGKKGTWRYRKSYKM